MKPLALRRTLVERAYDAIVDGICDGTIPTSTHLVQEQLAERLGVSRQPIQQALLLLRNDGVLQDAGRRRLMVPPLDPVSTRHRYAIRAALDVLAARLAAERCAAEPRVAAMLRQEGAIRLTEGRTAIREGTISVMIARDVASTAFSTAPPATPCSAPPPTSTGRSCAG
jgi:DNA-binding GntR family transcriptional regulator